MEPNPKGSKPPQIETPPSGAKVSSSIFEVSTLPV
jgi:hypothetical protein